MWTYYIHHGLLCSFHHYPPMNIYYSFLLLLVVLSPYSEGPQYAKPLDPLDSTVVTVCPDSSSAQLGILDLVLPQNEVSKIVLPQNKALTLSEVLDMILRGVFNFVLPPNGVFKIITANCQLFNNVKTTIKMVEVFCIYFRLFDWHVQILLL